MIKNIFKLVVAFVFGIGGGIFADQILWPYFIERPLFYEYRLEQAPTHITEKKEIVIEENTALQDAVTKVERVVVGVRTKTKTGVLEGSGLIITADGLMVVFSNLVPQGGDFTFFVDGETSAYQILKRDAKKNLALIKLKKENLSTVGFAEFGSLRFGQRVFLVASVLENNNLGKVVNEGIIKTYDKDLIKTNILEEKELQGSPLFNIKGELVGLNIINSKGEVSAIPITKIREFIGF